MTSSSGTSISEHGGELAADAGERGAERLGLRRPCAGSRRAGSRRRVLGLEALEDHADDHVVGHELARVHVAPWPSRRARCPRRRPARRMLPVAMYGRLKSSVMRSAWVPLPAPGGPTRMRLSSATGIGSYAVGRDGFGPGSLLQEALVVAHHQLRLELLHRVQRDADDDQQRRAAEEEVRAWSG